MNFIWNPASVAFLKRTTQKITKSRVRKDVKNRFCRNSLPNLCFDKLPPFDETLFSLQSECENYNDNYYKNFVDFKKKMDENIEKQIKNEMDIFVNLENVLPHDMPNRKTRKALNLYDTFIKEYSNIYEKCEFTLSDSSNEFNEIITFLSPSDVAKIVFEISSEDLFQNHNPLPFKYIKRMLSRTIIKYALVKYYSSLGYFEDISTIHKLYITKICEENIKPSINLFRDIVRDVNENLMTQKRCYFDKMFLEEFGGHLFWVFVLALKKTYEDVNFTISINKGQEEILCESNYFQSDAIISNKPEYFKIETRKIPSLVPAIPIYTYKSGGYLCNMNFNLIRGIILKLNRTSNKFQYERGYLDRFMNILSTAGMVGWKINEKVFSLLLELFQKNTSDKRLGLYKFEALNSWKNKGSLTKLEKDNMQKHLKEQFSLWSNLHKHIVVANSLRNKEFYLPLNIDFRGRCYPVSTFCHHYTHDSIRALLKFSIELPLGEDGLFWLKIHLSNKIGKFKTQKFQDRVKNIDKMIPEIHKVAESPLIYDWWMNCSDPWQTLAACFEISAALKSEDPKTYMCSLPIHQDGSCNGLQHYAAIGRNETEAKFVNLKNNIKINDIYSAISKRVNNSNWKDDVKGNKKLIKNLEITRKIVKQSVMTFVYGVTIYGAQKQIYTKLKDLIDRSPPKAENTIKSASFCIAGKVIEEVCRLFFSSHIHMTWLKSYAFGFVKSKKHVSWKTKYGLMIYQPYVSKNCEESMESKIIKKRKHVTAFPPNFVHSLDATHMLMTYERAINEGIMFSAVHDSFWCHPSNTKKMNEILREEFIKLHNIDHLRSLIEYARKKDVRIPDPPPHKSVFNLEEIKSSEQFFS